MAPSTCRCTGTTRWLLGNTNECNILLYTVRSESIATGALLMLSPLPAVTAATRVERP